MAFATGLCMLTSCGSKVEPIKNLTQKGSGLYGDYSWCVELTEDAAPLTLEPTDCDTLFNAAVTVTMRSNEKVKLPANMTAEYKEIYLYLSGYSKLGEMKPNEEGLKSIQKMLSSKKGSTAEITFISPEKLSAAVIQEEIEESKYFSITNMDFSVEGKLHKKELFKCLFDGDDVVEVLTKYENLVENLRKSYYTYEDEESTKAYEALELIYKEVYIFSSKLDESLDDDDLTNTQQERFETASSTYNKIKYDMD